MRRSSPKLVAALKKGIRDFGVLNWGPQPIRSGLWNLSDGCSFTMQVHGDSDMHTVHDIRGKRVNVGNPGSGQRATVEVVMEELGWTMDDFTLASELPSREQAQGVAHVDVDVHGLSQAERLGDLGLAVDVDREGGGR
jgi:ABC-type nitrate/sulfonate/bicarbonate transport system substrate-binding protein